MPLLQYPKEIKNPDAAFRFLEKNNLKNKTKKYSKMGNKLNLLGNL